MDLEKIQIVMEKMDKYKDVINGQIGLLIQGSYDYTKYNETEQYKKELEKYNKDLKNAQNTMTDTDFEKWWMEHEPPDLPSESRYIPTDENWDTVNSLIEKSIELKKDLLWDRYKDNLIDNDVGY